MEPKLIHLGGSLLVPKVQELAKKSLRTVPPRYVRPDQDPVVISNASSLHQVPVINMLSLLPGDSMDTELQKLHCACKEWGFFQLVNHGVSSELMERVKIEIDAFFNLPMEEKDKFGQEPGDLQGYGQAFVLSEEQKLDWGDMFYLHTLPPNLKNPDLFAKLPLSFRETIEAYSAELKSLSMKILCLLAKALKMDSQDMTELFDEGMQSMRMNYYPPCRQPEQVIGLTPHSDADALTILLQVNEMEGLQVKKDGNWIPVTPLPNAFVVNIGDILEIVSNGVYPSIEHRATVNSEKERLSVATFLLPKLDGEFGPARSLITPENPALFKRIGSADYLKTFISRELDGKSYLDVMKI